MSVRRLFAVAAILALVTSSCQTTSSTPDRTTGPLVGLFQSDSPVGVGPVGTKTCVGFRLDDATLRGRTLDVTWWSVGPAGCQTSSSGLVISQARLVPVTVPGSSGSVGRPGYRVELDVPLIPTGTETIAFTIDPEGASPEDGIPAIAGSTASGAPVLLERVQMLDVRTPGGQSPPTPRTP